MLELAEKYQEKLLDFLKLLVRERTVNGREPEKNAALRIANEATGLGLATELVALDPERPNVLVRWGSGERRFVLVGHIDTVAEGDLSTWSHDPFDPWVKGGCLFGRGAADNKAGIAISLCTIALLRDGGLLDPKKAQVILAAVVDEESGASSKLGVRHLLNRGLLQPAMGAIYTYASDIVCIGHRGLLRFMLRAIGQSVHTGSLAWNRKEQGVNAVTGLADILLRLEAADYPAPSHPAFGGFTCKVTPGTVMRGGEFESIVPARAEALVDVRLMPGQSSQAVLEIVERIIGEVKAVRPGLQVELEVKNGLPGAVIAPDHPLVRSAQRWTKAITGVEWPVMGAGPANEGYMLIGAGIPTLCGFGPTGGGAHAPDEWVEIASLTKTMAMYAGIIVDMVG